MRIIRTLAIFTLVFGKVALASSPLEGDYSFQLYFGDSKPFTDELSLSVGEDGELKGDMHVPNDFDAELEGIGTERSASGVGLILTFFITLPEKYHKTLGPRLFYELHFRTPDHFVGFVTHYKIGEYSSTYVGSVVGFKKR